jgi:glucan-binding YG repeat protein
MKMALFCLLLILSMLSALWLYSNPESILPPGQKEMHSTIEAGTEAAETASSKASASKVKETKPEPTAPKSTKPQETEPEKTEPAATEPKETQPKPTEPKETQPKPTEPKETQPKPTDPEETQPVEQHPVALMDLDEEELAPEKPVYDEQRESPASCWKEKDGNRYYQYSDGLYHTGWLELDGVFYYFHDDGRMAKSEWVEANDARLYFDVYGHLEKWEVE